MSTTVNTQYLNRSTPGVYITEIAAFGSSIVGVPTAIPVFIGYTEFAGDPSTGASLYNTPVSLSSMAEFQQYFGGAFTQPAWISRVLPTPPASGGSGSGSGSGAVSTTSASSPNMISAMFTTATTGSPPTYDAQTGQFLISLTSPTGTAASGSSFNLYWQMMLFFANGGGSCYVVSVGSYWVNEYPTSAPGDLAADWIVGDIQAAALTGSSVGSSTTGVGGIQAAGFQIGPTMIVVPEACQLDQSDYATVAQAMISQAATLQDRVAILDLPGCLGQSTYNALLTGQTNLSLAIAPQAGNLSYAAAYAPALLTTIVSANDILYTNLATTGDLASVELANNILTTQAVINYGAGTATLANVQAAIATAFPLSGVAATNTQQYSNNPAGYTSWAQQQAMAGNTTTLSGWQTNLDNYLMAALPIFKTIETVIANNMNVAPASAIMAGVWSASDARNGVWNAPANIALASVSAPAYVMNDTQQAGFNIPTNGQSICIIRSQPSRGSVVWGARTLDGNSLDYRYIQVRRTLVYIEQSIKTALQQYVFAANDATTWSTVTAAVSGFLAGLWQQGGLMGSKPANAFTVSCGLGSTMTAQDILNGYMIVAITISLVHPAEFIELTFTQTVGS